MVLKLCNDLVRTNKAIKVSNHTKVVNSDKKLFKLEEFSSNKMYFIASAKHQTSQDVFKVPFNNREIKL